MRTKNLFASQVWALMKKNFVMILARQWFSTSLRAIILPIAFTVVMLEIPVFSTSSNGVGIGQPRDLLPLADTLHGKPLVLVRTPNLGDDFGPVLKAITDPLPQDLVVILDDEDKIPKQCPVNFQGVSPCHAVVIFDQSPGSQSPGSQSPGSQPNNATWAYTIKVDPKAETMSYSVGSVKSNQPEALYLPLQNAIETAMLGDGNWATPQVIPYAGSASIEVALKQAKKQYLGLVPGLVAWGLFVANLPAVQHIASMICSDREAGMSQLIDAMGGGAAWSRVISYCLSFMIIYLPLWIVLGALFGALLVTKTSMGITIVWHILSGWALTNSCAFGAALFKKSAMGSSLVLLISFVIAAGGYGQVTSLVNPSVGQIVILSLLFTPMNYMNFVEFIAKAELKGQPVDLGSALSKDPTGRDQYPYIGVPWVTQLAPFVFWICLVVQIIGYPLLATAVEVYLHGNNRKRRSFDTSEAAAASSTVVETKGLVKHYGPGWFKWLCCCCCASRKVVTKAVDGLDLKGQKGQILCLLGPNGSGKTTTLEMLAGFHAPTDGSININNMPSQIGICPQKNVLWNNLTVWEHLKIWNTMKGMSEDDAALEQLLERCDLTLKRKSLAKNLSGGMKRKLQLACMLVGGSSVCLLDEVTSGLDPLSRRAIWNAILAERKQRSMIFTTHFLDESEVLSDHIAILSLGNMKCQGAPAELKNQYGGGYRVHLPRSGGRPQVEYPVTERRDTFIVTTPDSSTAAQVLSNVDHGAGSDRDVFVTGPTIEDVFLHVSEEPHALAAEDDRRSASPTTMTDDFKTQQQEAPLSRPNPSMWATYSGQIRALLFKRIIILRSQWWLYIVALLIPIIGTSQLRPLIAPRVGEYHVPTCDEALKPIGFSSYDSPYGLYSLTSFELGPPEINATVTKAVNATTYSYSSSYGGGPTGPFVQDTKQDFIDYLYKPGMASALYYGGLYYEKPFADSVPLIGVPINSYGGGGDVMSLVTQLRAGENGVKIEGRQGTLQQLGQEDGSEALSWIIFFCLVQVIYPAFFSIYPSYEKGSQVRANQYSNGIRPLSLWLSYLTFDFFWSFIVAIVSTVLLPMQAPFWAVSNIFGVLFFYGIASILLVYLLSLAMRSQAASFACSLLVLVIMFVISVFTTSSLSSDQTAVDGLTFGLGLVFPIQNVLRACMVSLNTYLVRCRGDIVISNPGDFYAYGGPMFLLIVQILLYGTLLLWIEGSSFAWFSRITPNKNKNLSGKNVNNDDYEMTLRSSGRSDVDREADRVANSSETDFLRMVHLTKQFGSYTAVDNVSLGLQSGEILALLGPNGAGKTTAINMIRGDMNPSSGKVFLEQHDVHRNIRLAQRSLGVCPQFDALDLLTVREHLEFYARCKGVTDIKADVEYVMSRVGLHAHSKKLASALSGGNKRKLSLAIALVGNPPVLLLDEPSSAMDAASKRVLWKTLEAVAPGRSVLLTTHSMEEADALATRCAIVSRKMLAVGSTNELRQAHSNEYHVHLILTSGHFASQEEMDRVATWVKEHFPNVRFEGENLGGQVRFIVPADSQVPEAYARRFLASSDNNGVEQQRQQQGSPSFTKYLIETLEGNKAALGVDCYSIGAATMERVFLSVVKESDAVEEEEPKKRWWRYLS